MGGRSPRGDPESDPESDPELAVMAFCAIPADSPRVAYGDSAGSVRVLGLLEA